MSTQLIVDGNAVYEIDQECLQQKQRGYRSQPFRMADRGQSENNARNLKNKKKQK